MQPLNEASHSFWDHLSRTRADEYATEDDLARLPIPPAPVPAPAQRPQIATAQAPALGHDPEGANARAPHANRAVWPSDPALATPSSTQVGAPGHQGGAAFVTAPPPARTMPPAHAVQQTRKRRGIGTGRLAYRVQRLWLTPFIRRALTIGLPAGVVALGIMAYFLNPENRANLMAQADAAYALVVDRPEFMVTDLDLVQPLPPEVAAAIRDVVEPLLPQSSFRLDLAALRTELERLDAIRLADLRLSADGKLAIGITQRVPAILWRSNNGLEVLDAEGVRIGFVTDRAALPDLPLVAGDGADAQIGEALDLIEAATPLGPRLLGLVRMGERRWDVVLDRDQTIRLPEADPIAALERIIALDQAQDLLARDVMVTDLRNPARPVLQVSAGALETIRALRGTSTTERSTQ